jgi:hypothetical protein
MINNLFFGFFLEFSLIFPKPSPPLLEKDFKRKQHMKSIPNFRSVIPRSLSSSFGVPVPGFVTTSDHVRAKHPFDPHGMLQGQTAHLNSTSFSLCD